MTQVCPSCNAENRDIAKFCDQCGRPLTPDVIPAAPATGAAPSRQGVNWTAILFILALLLFFVWLFRSPGGRQEQAPQTSGGTASNPAATMQQVQDQIAQLKQRVETDPLDTAAIAELYQLYSQIGQADKVRPMLQTSTDAVIAQADTLGRDKAVGLLADIAQAAASASDIEGSIVALKGLHAVKPEDAKVLWFIGNLYFDLDRAADSIEWYDKYLAAADPDSDSDYWNARVDRNTMLLRLSDDQQNPALIEEAITNLKEVTELKPDMWAARFNLGQAYQKHGDAGQAAAAYKLSRQLATDDLLRWRSDEALALLEGREPPPMPNPHGEGMGMEGMVNPHAEGAPNPHGEGVTTVEGVENPHEEAGSAAAP